MLKQYVDFNAQKIIKAEKNGDKDGKALYKSMNNSVYRKIIKKLKKQNRWKTCEPQKKLSKVDIQTKLYVTQNN